MPQTDERSTAYRPCDAKPTAARQHMGQFNVDSFHFNYLAGENADGVYTLSIDYVGGGYPGEKFQRVIEVPCNMPLSSLHKLIQHLTGFNDDKIYDFYIASSIRGKKEWLKRAGVWKDDGKAAFDTSIDQIFVSKTKRKLYYSFEFGDNWIFEIGRKGDVETPLYHMHYPRIVHSRGLRPI
jgi:hypothetical protein